MKKKISGLLEHWLDNVKTQMSKHMAITHDRMCELNVIVQVRNLSNSTIVQKAWKQGREHYIHGWIYSISDGLIKDLNVPQHELKDNPGRRSR